MEFGKARVMCIGDLMLDAFVYGAVERLSPEAPVPVLRYRERVLSLGGVGNVLANLCSLGAEATIAAAVGSDGAGAEIARLLQALLPEAGIRLVEEAGRSTTLKTRFVGAGQHLLRLDEETIQPLRPATQALLAERARAWLEAGNGVLVLSDYAKGGLPQPLVGELIAAARARAQPVIVDPKGSDYARYRGASILTPNTKELAAVAGQALPDEAALIEAARGLAASVEVDHVLVTRSEKGMTLVPRHGEPRHVAGQAREVFDVSGAGDTVVATLAAALASGRSLEEAVDLANLAGGIVVGKLGTAAVNARELGEAHRLRDLSKLSRGVAELDDARRIATRWREGGLKVGFTNGVFDLLHLGHITLIREARRHCDRLILGLNSDASVKRLKGPSRPVQSETVRGAILAALAEVDLVTVFEADTPRELIAALRPDVLVKGSDYRIDQVVGADIVQGYGGRVVLADLVEGYSTTSTISRLQAGEGAGPATPA